MFYLFQTAKLWALIDLMYQKIIISFLFYLAGVLFSPVLAHGVSSSDDSSFHTLADDISEYSSDIDELFRGGDEFESGDYPVSASLISCSFLITNGDSLQQTGEFSLSDYAAQRPLYLLYHSFLFYDLI